MQQMYQIKQNNRKALTERIVKLAFRRYPRTTNHCNKINH